MKFIYLYNYTLCIKTKLILDIKFPMIPLGRNTAASFPKSDDAFFSKTINKK